MITNFYLQTSIHLLNDFCAEAETFSFKRLATLRLRELALQVNAELRELTMVINCIEAHQFILQEHLVPDKRLYQLLGLHFKKVHIKLRLPDDPIEESIHLETILLGYEASTNLRDVNLLGARLRRALNVALQGHTGVLWLHDDDDIEHLKVLWKRGRVTQLIEKNEIMHSYDANGKLVKLWKRGSSEENEEDVVTID